MHDYTSFLYVRNLKKIIIYIGRIILLHSKFFMRVKTFSSIDSSFIERERERGKE